MNDYWVELCKTVDADYILKCSKERGYCWICKNPFTCKECNDSYQEPPPETPEKILKLIEFITNAELNGGVFHDFSTLRYNIFLKSIKTQKRYGTYDIRCKSINEGICVTLTSAIDELNIDKVKEIVNE